LVGVTVTVTGVPAHTVVEGVTFVTATEGVSTGFTVTVIAALVAVGVAGQAYTEVTTTETWSLLFSVDEVNVLLVVLDPTFTPFTRHWYNGAAPALVAVAVNVTLVPAQKVDAGETLVIETVGVNIGFTVTVTAALVAVGVVGQGSFEVTTTDTWSLLFSEFEVNVLEVVLLPTFVPFTLHWYRGVVPELAAVAVKVTLVPAQKVLAGETLLMLTVGVV
jgi:hypothetical protein